MTVYRYEFADGTILRLIDRGLSVEEGMALVKLHGNVVISIEEIEKWAE